ncbi:hypothetical protein UFOVP410_80 [uncultured Caudovirales phage]|uniref:Uncharacterized protein n=1 Tax=uncultured Caudovirales phage TaxID=2100421 RepID=A0A6J5M538_9CAUD|nr:hypothetical protein UFOVP410_80 [uncultured Caudovirales phage]
MIFKCAILLIAVFLSGIEILHAQDISAAPTHISTPTNTTETPSKLTNVGIAVFNLTANRFNCSGFIATSKPLDELHISFLYNTFGNNFRCLKILLNDKRLKTLQVHLINEPGHRNRRLGKYEFLYNIKSPSDYNSLISKNDAKLKTNFNNYVLPLKQFLEQNLRKDTELIISPGLESNLSDANGKILIRWTREVFPNARVVWNPLRFNQNSLKSSRGDLLESHGLFPSLFPPCVYNSDGSDVSYPNRPALGQNEYTEGKSKNWIQSGAPVFQLYEQMSNLCENSFFWVAESNAIDYRNGFVDPRLRNNRISTKDYRRIMSDVINLHKNGIIYPPEYNYTKDDDFITSSCSEIRENFVDGFKRGKLLKQSEFRNRGAVLLLPKEFDDVSIAYLYSGKTIVDTYVKTNNYKDGRNMFRSKISPTTYPLKTYLMLNKKTSKICYKIPNPRIRLD